MSEIRQLLVFHRNCLFRDCLVEYLSSDGQFAATSVDHSVSDSAASFLDDSSDIVLLDLNLPDGLAVEIAREIQRRKTATKIIVLVPDEHDQLVECIAAGAHGCVLERSPLEDLTSAITKVLAGENFCSSEIVGTMFAQIAKLGGETNWRAPASTSLTRLTVRENEVLELLSKRLSNKEIAKELCVSLFTVKNHVHNILEKLEVENRSEAVEAAKRNPQSVLL
jgi:DNA-binding NarL/FixJ family response regulator